jgi:hypothetical protein
VVLAPEPAPPAGPVEPEPVKPPGFPRKAKAALQADPKYKELVEKMSNPEEFRAQAKEGNRRLEEWERSETGPGQQSAELAPILKALKAEPPKAPKPVAAKAQPAPRSVPAACKTDWKEAAKTRIRTIAQRKLAAIDPPDGPDAPARMEKVVQMEGHLTSSVNAAQKEDTCADALSAIEAWSKQ